MNERQMQENINNIFMKGLQMFGCFLPTLFRGYFLNRWCQSYGGGCVTVVWFLLFSAFIGRFICNQGTLKPRDG